MGFVAEQGALYDSVGAPGSALCTGYLTQTSPPFPLVGVFENPIDRPHDYYAGRVSVIIPIYNEAQNVEAVLRAVDASPVLKEVIVVDDGSTDGSREKLLACARGPGKTLVLHERNFGKGAAIRSGLRYARGEYILIQDSDLEYSPEDYPRLLQPLWEGKSNVVYGVRGDTPARGFMFYYGAKFLTLLTNVLFRTQIHDEPTCYKVFRRSSIEELRLECKGFEFCEEVTAKIARLGEHIVEVPISYVPRARHQGKKIRLLVDGWRAVWTLVRYRVAARSSLRRKVGENETV